MSVLISIKSCDMPNLFSLKLMSASTPGSSDTLHTRICNFIQICIKILKGCKSIYSNGKKEIGEVLNNN